MTTQTHIRYITKLVQGKPTQDGAGVELTRMIGSAEMPSLDPILLFDVFGSDDPNAYIAGFPPHPHRGFETVTYMLAGKMRHQDSAGHNGVIEAGDVQWMTAGKGIIHSEMPEQEVGRLAGLQLWLNLPAEDKMTVPKYQEYAKSAFPVEHPIDGIDITVVSGMTEMGTKGPVQNTYTNPVFWVIDIQAGCTFTDALTDEHNAFVYVVSGQINFEDQSVNEGQMAVLSKQGRLQFTATENSQVLLVAAAPLDEPIARSGPFVMNNREQLEQAYQDYRDGTLA